MDKSKHIPWELLNGSPIIDEILSDWKRLLDDKSQREHAYQDFLRHHATMFFPPIPSHDEIILSGLKLGADHEIDFVMAHSERSMGFVYTLIEIETPHESAYTQSGDPKARLIHAIQQTSDWKSWMEKNSGQVQRLFPSKRAQTTGLNHFRHMVVMGRRSDRFNEKRNSLSQQNGIQIRSFDWFTDNLINRQFQSFNKYSHDIIGPSHTEINKFSNPFSIAYTDAQWRSIVDDTRLRSSHMVAHNIEILTRHRTYNTAREAAFMKYLKTLPDQIKMPSEASYWRINQN